MLAKQNAPRGRRSKGREGEPTPRTLRVSSVGVDGRYKPQPSKVALDPTYDQVTVKYPRPIRRAHRAVWIGIAGTVVLMVTGTALWSWALEGGPGQLDRWGGLVHGWGIVITQLPLYAGLITCFVSSRRWRRKAAVAKGRLCLHCGFPLIHLVEQGTCPECGSAYRADEAERTWERAVHWKKVAGAVDGAAV
jgi:hypothetical protein